MSTGYEALFAPAMRLALAEAAGAAAGADPAGADVPVGAVILDADGAVVARARQPARGRSTTPPRTPRCWRSALPRAALVNGG